MTDRPANPDLPWPGAVPPPPMPNVADAPLGRVGPPVAPDDPTMAEFTRPREMAAGLGPAEPVEERGPANPGHEETDRAAGDLALGSTAPDPDALPRPAAPETPERLAEPVPDAADVVGTPEVDPKAVVRLHFVPCTHIVENAPAITNALDAAGCKAVAIEIGGGTPEQRAAVQRNIDTILDPETTQAVRNATLEELAHQDAFVAGIMLTRHPSLERATLFDVDSGHPSQVHLQAAREADLDLRTGIQIYAPNAFLRQAARTAIEEMAAAAPLREPTRLEQLEAFSRAEAQLAAQQATARGEPLAEPHVIGVVTGSLHDDTRESMADDGYNCTTTPPIEDPNPFRQSPKLVGQLIVKHSQDPSLRLTPEDVDRALLESTAHYVGFLPAQATELATSLPSQMLGPLMNKLDATKQFDVNPMMKRFAIFEQLEQAHLLLQAIDETGRIQTGEF